MQLSSQLVRQGSKTGGMYDTELYGRSQIFNQNGHCPAFWLICVSVDIGIQVSKFLKFQSIKV